MYRQFGWKRAFEANGADDCATGHREYAEAEFALVFTDVLLCYHGSATRGDLCYILQGLGTIKGQKDRLAAA